jgi:putative transposase
MTKTRHSYPAELKARVALEAVKGTQTINQIASEYGVHPSQVNTWKKQLSQELPTLFARTGQKQNTAQQHEQLTDQLYQQIGQLKVELDWLKKKAARFGLES